MATWAEGTVQSIAIDRNNVYWTLAGEAMDGTVMRMPKAGGTPIVLASKQDAPGALAVDGKSIYWATRTSLMKMPLDGHAVNQLVTGQDTLLEIAIDATSLYWTNSGKARHGAPSGTVMKVPIDGGTPTTLATSQVGPGAIAVGSGFVYFATESSIMKLASTGGVPLALVSGQSGVGDVAIDAANVYWMACSNSNVMVGRVSLNGGAPTTLASDPSSYCGHITVSGEYVYWTTRYNEVNRVLVKGGKSEVLNTETMYFDVYDLAGDQDHVYWADFAIWNAQHSTVTRVMRSAK